MRVKIGLEVADFVFWLDVGSDSYENVSVSVASVWSYDLFHTLSQSSGILLDKSDSIFRQNLEATLFREVSTQPAPCTILSHLYSIKAVFVCTAPLCHFQVHQLYSQLVQQGARGSHLTA